jgi:hypothetical protein
MTDNDIEIKDEDQMCPRDWFAAIAMHAIVSKRLKSRSMDSNFIELATYDAYSIADEMMGLRD